MWDMEPRKILVAVDSDCDSALQYAVAEALRRGCGIHVTRVDRPAIWSSYVLDEVSLVEGELRRPGASILAAAAARVEALLDQEAPDDERLSVSTELTHGSVVGALQALSRHACLVVLQHHGMGPAGETSTLSVTAGLAAAAHCPVVAVPESWHRETDEVGTVVVGVEDPARDRVLLESALHEAARRAPGFRSSGRPSTPSTGQPTSSTSGSTMSPSTSWCSPVRLRRCSSNTLLTATWWSPAATTASTSWELRWGVRFASCSATARYRCWSWTQSSGTARRLAGPPPPGRGAEEELRPPQLFLAGSDRRRRRPKAPRTLPCASAPPEALRTGRPLEAGRRRPAG